MVEVSFFPFPHPVFTFILFSNLFQVIQVATPWYVMSSTPPHFFVRFLTSLLPAPALSSSLTFVACVLAFGFSLTAPAPDSTSSPLLSVEEPPPLSYPYLLCLLSDPSAQAQPNTYLVPTHGVDYDAVRTGFDSTQMR